MDIGRIGSSFLDLLRGSSLPADPSPKRSSKYKAESFGRMMDRRIQKRRRRRDIAYESRRRNR